VPHVTILPRTPSQPEPPPVPQLDNDLFRRLHEANEQFHQARQQLEAVMDGSDYRHQERVDQANEKFREAEQRVEEIEAQIAAKLPPTTHHPSEVRNP
jgi:hypothetical protein